ncbi:MAG: GMC oxidoreductase [Bryobacteraceae bacterium]
MGLNQKKSVVNSYSRTHDVPNLFVVDGSNFVTSAGSSRLRRFKRSLIARSII